MLELCDAANRYHLKAAAESPAIGSVLKSVLYHQHSLFQGPSSQDFVAFVLLQLYNICSNAKVADQDKHLACDIWRAATLLQRDTVESTLASSVHEENTLVATFEEVLQIDSDQIMHWLVLNQPQLDKCLKIEIGAKWKTYCASEHNNAELADADLVRYKHDNLKARAAKVEQQQNVLRRHETSTNNWLISIVQSEDTRLMKLVQDNEDAEKYIQSLWKRLKLGLIRSEAPDRQVTTTISSAWQLDATECPNRQRRKVRLIRPIAEESSSPSEDTKASATPTTLEHAQTCDFEVIQEAEVQDAGEVHRLEDKNRKVLRSLEHGDIVQEVFNISVSQNS